MEYILFGAGNVGKRVLNCIGKEKVVCFVDNSKVDLKIEGVKVISVEELKRIHPKYTVIISVEKRSALNEISEWLDTNSIPWISVYEAYKRENVDFVRVKHENELDFWQSQFGRSERSDVNNYYKNMVLSIANEDNSLFLTDKIVADFGCGPQGSLTFLDNARERIGIDVLSREYTEEFGQDMITHKMLYVTSTEKFIPVPSRYVDCLITINSLDHVTDLSAMCSEIKRILKPNGLLLGSFNLFEPRTECEPQTLTEELLDINLLKDFDVEQYRLSEIDENDAYRNIRLHKYIESPDGSIPCVLWVKGRRR